jgi:hypothetical protein
MEARGLHVTASFPSSGVYALAAAVDDVFLGRPVQGSTMYFAMIIHAYQRAGWRLYARPEQLLNPRYPGAETMLPNATPFAQLLAEGRLPKLALFDEAPPALPAKASPALRALFAKFGPAHAPARFKSYYDEAMGAEPMFPNAARLALLQDMAAHPDGSYPDYSSGLPSRTARHPFRRAVAANDLRGWMPKAPLVMCGGHDDPSSPFRFGGQMMMRYWSSTENLVPPGRVTLIDLDLPAEPGDRYGWLNTNLAEMRRQITAEKGERAYLDLHHGVTMPRYCYTAARMFFDTMK